MNSRFVKGNSLPSTKFVNNLKRKDVSQLIATTLLVAAIVIGFVLSSVFGASGLTATEEYVPSHVLEGAAATAELFHEPIEGEGLEGLSLSIPDLEYIANEEADRDVTEDDSLLSENANDDSFADANADDEAFLNGELPSEGNETLEDGEELAAEEVEALEAGIAAFAYVPITDAVPGLDPVPTGAVGVNSVAALNTAIANANGAGSTYIYLTGTITGGTANGAGLTNAINNAGLRSVDGRQGLTIDGRGHRFTHGTGGDGTFNLDGASGDRVFTLKNIDIVPSTSSTAVGDNTSVIAAVPMGGATGGWSAGTNANSRFWTVNIHSVRTVSAGGAFWSPAAGARGFLSLSDGEVNFSGENHLQLDQRRTLINARKVNFIDGETILNLARISDIANVDARRMNVIRSSPSNDTARALGVGVTLSGGAEVSINRDVRSGTGGIEGNAILINSGGLTTANVRPAVLELREESSLTVIANPRGTGTSAANNGVVSLRGGSGGVNVTEGSELLVHNTRRGTGANAGTSALIQEIRGGGFAVEGQDTRATFISESAEHRRQATIRFYMAGGASNQTVEVTDGAELNIERRRFGGDREVAALRFGQGTGNGFLVENATVNVHNEGTNNTVNPGTSRANGFNAGVEFAANNWFFHVLGDSDMQIYAERGAGINARAHRNGEIRVTQGANFTVMGRTAGTGANDAAIRATGGNVHFVMDNPQFYDFVNTRPGGGRVFALGTRAGNTFTSTNSDISVWRRGVNAWNGEPDSHWTLIDVHLRGAHLRTVDAGRSYADFVRYYNTSPNTRRMESFTRISGNNSQPVLKDSLDLTNADRHVRVLAETPEGRIRDPRPVWTNELWGNFTHICGQTGNTQSITSNDAPAGSLVRSFFEETLYEVETNVETVDGALRMTHDDGRFLHAGDQYRVDAAWRATTPDLSRNHQAPNVPTDLETVRDVVPPMPVTIQDTVVPIAQVNFEGTWSLENSFDDGPLVGGTAVDNIRLHARSGNGPVREITGNGSVLSDNTWTFSADHGQLSGGDIVWVTLADTQSPPNWNPLQPTPVRDRMIPEASWFVVAPDGIMPVVVQYFFEGAEHMPYRLISNQLSFPNPGDPRTATMGTGTSTDTHLYFPAHDRQGYKVDSIELRGPGGTVVENIALDSNGRPVAPINVSPGNVTIYVNYVLDPEYTRDILVEFRFADYGGTGANSWTLQVPVPYTQVRTGTYNIDGVNRFPAQGIGDFHITETISRNQILALVNGLFEESYDSATGITTPAAIPGGLPRGFVPSSENFIQLPQSGTGPGGTQLEFPVAMADLYNTQVSAVNTNRRPVIINYEATLETVTLTQEVNRCPDLAGTEVQRNIFDNELSFNYEVVLSRGPVGGRTAAAGGGVTGWTNHRLALEVSSDRFSEDPFEWITHTWHGGAQGGSSPGGIRVGNWNGTSGPGGGHADSGTGTTGAPTAAISGQRRVGINDELVIENVPSTAYIAVTQQINGTPAGVTTAPGAPLATWLNNALANHHEREFSDSGTDNLSYMWPAHPWHLANDSAANNGTSNAIHTTNWANPLPTDNNPAHVPGRPMDSSSRDFDFRIVPRTGYQLTVTNQVTGADADMDRARYFTVQLRDENGNYLAVGRQLMLHVGEYTQGPLVTDPVTGDETYTMQPVLTPVTVGANGLISTGLPALLPGESFTLMRTGGMYEVRVVMLDFAGYEDYDVSNFYQRENESVPSEVVVGMASAPASFNRDYVEFVFESHREDPFVIPAGLLVGGSAVFVVALAVVGAAGAIVARQRRIELEKL